MYDKPVLSTDQSLVLLPGENISFKCSSAHNLFNRFSLAKEGGASLPLHQHKESQGNFHLGPVNADFIGKIQMLRLAQQQPLCVVSPQWCLGAHCLSYISRLREAWLHDGEFNPDRYGWAGPCDPLGDSIWRLVQPQDLTQGMLSGMGCEEMEQTGCQT